MKKQMNKVLRQTEFWVFLIIIFLALIIQARSGAFFANNNIVDIMRSMIPPCTRCALCSRSSARGPMYLSR